MKIKILKNPYQTLQPCIGVIVEATVGEYARVKSTDLVKATPHLTRYRHRQFREFKDWPLAKGEYEVISG